MKVLLINAVNKFSSTGSICSDILEYINDKKGGDCKIAHSFGPVEENSIVIGNKLDTKIHALLSRLTGRICGFSIIHTYLFLRKVDKIKPDIIHIHNIHSNYINLSLLFRYIANKNIPTVITLHDCFFFTGKCCYYSANRCDKWKFSCGECRYLNYDNKVWFWDQTRKLLNEKKKLISNMRNITFIGVSDWIVGEARQSIIKEKDIIRLYNWIDLSIFKPYGEIEDVKKIKKRLGVEDKKVILGVSSLWSNRKGLGDYIKLAKMLEDDTVILLVGEMPKAVELPSNIISIPATENAVELAMIYSLSNVFVTFSKEETFGKVSAEALACGTPVVCYNVTACPELVDENCGCVIPYGEVNVAREKIKEILERDKSEYISNCTLFSRKQFNKEDILELHFKLYENCLTNRENADEHEKNKG